jgi:hypothetical protein
MRESISSDCARCRWLSHPLPAHRRLSKLRNREPWLRTENAHSRRLYCQPRHVVEVRPVQHVHALRHRRHRDRVEGVLAAERPLTEHLAGDARERFVNGLDLDAVKPAPGVPLAIAPPFGDHHSGHSERRLSDRPFLPELRERVSGAARARSGRPCRARCRPFTCRARPRVLLR